VLPAPSRIRPGTLILNAVLMVIAQPFCLPLLKAAPCYVVLCVLVVLSLAAFAILELFQLVMLTLVATASGPPDPYGTLLLSLIGK
jgi:uncharacterized membrane protein